MLSMSSHLQGMLYWCIRHTPGVPVEEALQFVSLCCSGGSAGGQWGFGNEVTQLSLEESRECWDGELGAVAKNIGSARIAMATVLPG